MNSGTLTTTTTTSQNQDTTTTSVSSPFNTEYQAKVISQDRVTNFASKTIKGIEDLISREVNTLGESMSVSVEVFTEIPGVNIQTGYFCQLHQLSRNELREKVDELIYLRNSHELNSIGVVIKLYKY